MSDNMIARPKPSVVVAPSAPQESYVDWAAILAGGVFALAISFLLISFGTGLGLSLTSPYRGEGMSAAWLAIAAGIWFAWVMVTGFGAGGYVAGRMRRRAGDATAPEVEARDCVHGLMVWATGALVGTVLAATGVGGLVSTGASAVGSAAETVTDVAASTDYFANLMLRRGVSEPATDEAGTDEAANDTQPATSNAGQVASTGLQPTRQTTDVTGVDLAVQQEIASIIAHSAASGEMAERDRNYLAQLVAANSDLDRTTARARVDDINAEIADARATALAAVEKARIAGVVFGFIAAATLLIGAVAAFFAAAVGGRHRDEGLGFDAFAVRR